MNLNDKDIAGGSFWRITPMINWYMTRIMRVEFIYGHGVLERYGMSGNINLFQTRLQLTIL
jgi:phosphate-selective porin OprO/OprP